MTTLTVWLLVLWGRVYGGSNVAVQPVMFPTLHACEQVAKNSGGVWARCIQTQVVKP